MAAGDLCQSGRAFQAHDPESFGFHPAKIPARSAADIQDQAAGGEAVREGRQEGGGVGEVVLEDAEHRVLSPLDIIFVPPTIIRP